jgi:hypothetical protein
LQDKIEVEKWISIVERIVIIPILAMAVKSFAVEKRFESPR